MQSPARLGGRSAVSRVGLIALALALTGWALWPSRALAEEFRPNRVAVDYIEPRSERLEGVYARLKQSGLLEELAQFLAPVRLPTTLRLWGTECYAYAEWMAYYDPQEHVIRLCYEWVERLEKMRAAARGPRQALVRENQIRLRDSAG